MLTVVAQTARPNWLIFFREPMDILGETKAKKIRFFYRFFFLRNHVICFEKNNEKLKDLPMTSSARQKVKISKLFFLKELQT